MAHHQRDAVIAGIDARDDALRFGDRQPEPVHAGVDVDGGAAGPAGAAAEHVPFGEFVEVADHRPAVDLGVGVAGVLEEAVEHIDGRRRHRGADHARLRRALATKKVLQPAPASARATCSAPQP